MARHSEGSDVLRSDVTDWTPGSLWRICVQLTEAGAAFRIQQRGLGLRPIWHQKAEGVQAHILVCFLGCVLWKALEYWQQRAELDPSPRAILDEPGRIQSPDVVLPVADWSGRELRTRCIVRPEEVQALLLERLGLQLPERLRIPSRIDSVGCQLHGQKRANLLQEHEPAARAGEVMLARGGA